MTVDNLHDGSSTVPVMTQEKFADKTGLRPDQVRGQVARGHLPSVKVGKLRMVNLVQLARTCLEADPAKSKSR
jgi:hypothetical protein